MGFEITLSSIDISPVRGPLHSSAWGDRFGIGVTDLSIRSPRRTRSCPLVESKCRRVCGWRALSSFDAVSTVGILQDVLWSVGSLRHTRYDGQHHKAAGHLNL